MKLFIGAPFKATKDNTWIVKFVENVVNTTNIEFDFGLVGWMDDRSKEVKENLEKIRELLNYCNNCNNKEIILYPGPQGISCNWNRLINMALKQDAQYIVIDNDDILQAPIVEGQCWASLMMKELDNNKDLGIVSPEWRWCSNNNSIDSYGEIKLQPLVKKSRRGIQGPCFMFKREVVDKLLSEYDYVFDEDFRCMWEEVEMLCRLHKLGYKSAIAENIPFYHYGSKTLSQDSQFSNEWYQRGKKLFHQKTGAPDTGNAPHVTFSVHDAIYMYRHNSDEPWNEFLG